MRYYLGIDMIKRRKDILDEMLEDLDEHCSLILVGITMNPGIGFNQLHKELRKHSNHREVAKSTLSEHLKHLSKKNLIEKEIVEGSPLKIKPTKYRTSSHFKELSKGFVAQSTTQEDFLPLMISEDVKSLTKHLMRIILLHLTDCMKSTLQVPENISVLNMHQLFYNIETLMKAYRERILQKKEETTALKTIDEWFSNVNQRDIDSS